jgi:hypothetical protein
MSVDPLGPVVITAREIYDQLVRLTDGIGTMATRMAQMTDALDDSKKDIADHEVRLRSLERARWPLPTVAVLISAGALILALLQR